MPDLKEVRRKAEKGSPVNQGYLGWAYLYGHETEVDYREALRWLQAAAYEGRAARPFIHLGRMYEEGLGVPRDIKEAIRHYEAVQDVEPRAALALARIYAKGDGVRAKPAKALKLYALVAECESVKHNPEVVAFAGAVTPEEVEEAKAYVNISH
ncbi:MAG TPA: tetratricopeptide repeat protein [Candidatus Angelobacter sp.]|nr:tetratricopeptide repeat protein [Candidatus Angelobacter sp.]